ILEAGVTFLEREEKKPKILEGLTFVFTGTLKSMGREDAKKRVLDLGGRVSDSVSKGVNYVVVGEAPGSKYQKALQLGIKILKEEEFLKMIESV
ncbi:MAG: NAD-dependent DNA ligase LigA, partial [Thermodesulfobacteriaceae bacterium]|nr:NAD-dependent DNA ligase LigA [Thermodesulfobacteriaceae bacterium]